MDAATVRPLLGDLALRPRYGQACWDAASQLLFAHKGCRTAKGGDSRGGPFRKLLRDLQCRYCHRAFRKRFSLEVHLLRCGNPEGNLGKPLEGGHPVWSGGQPWRGSSKNFVIDLSSDSDEDCILEVRTIKRPRPVINSYDDDIGGGSDVIDDCDPKTLTKSPFNGGLTEPPLLPISADLAYWRSVIEQPRLQPSVPLSDPYLDGRVRKAWDNTKWIMRWVSPASGLVRFSRVPPPPEGLMPTAENLDDLLQSTRSSRVGGRYPCETSGGSSFVHDASSQGVPSISCDSAESRSSSSSDGSPFTAGVGGFEPLPLLIPHQTTFDLDKRKSKKSRHEPSEIETIILD